MADQALLALSENPRLPTQAHTIVFCRTYINQSFILSYLSSPGSRGGASCLVGQEADMTPAWERSDQAHYSSILETTGCDIFAVPGYPLTKSVRTVIH